MKIGFYFFFAITAFFYVRTLRAIWRLVAESRLLESGVHFNRFNWTPALKVHRIGYPESHLRRQIVIGFLFTWAFMMVALVFLVHSQTHVLVTH
jgi:hypothetical protein